MNREFPPYESMLENGVSLPDPENEEYEPDPDEAYEEDRAEDDYEREIAESLSDELVRIARGITTTELHNRVRSGRDPLATGTRGRTSLLQRDRKTPEAVQVNETSLGAEGPSSPSVATVAPT